MTKLTSSGAHEANNISGFHTNSPFQYPGTYLCWILKSDIIIYQQRSYCQAPLVNFRLWFPKLYPCEKKIQYQATRPCLWQVSITLRHGMEPSYCLNQWLPMISLTKCQWFGAVILYVVFSRTGCWTNIRVAGDLWRHGATVTLLKYHHNFKIYPYSVLITQYYQSNFKYFRIKGLLIIKIRYISKQNRIANSSKHMINEIMSVV